jgi:hypothetical protein
MLELPTNAKGRLGQCPACNATFTIGEAAKSNRAAVIEAAPAETNLPDPVAVAEPSSKNESTNQDPPSSAAVDADQVGGRLSASGDRLSSPPSPRLELTDCAIEDVLSTTLAIFQARWKAAIMPFLVSVVATCVVVVMPALILGAINDAGYRTLTVLGMIIFIPIAFVFTVFLFLGMVRAELAVARNQQAPLSQMSSPQQMLLSVVVVSLVLVLTVAIAVGVMFSFIAILRGSGAAVLARILVPLGIALLIAILFGLLWQVWSWMFVCGDGKGTAVGSLRAAVAISSQNKLTSFFLVLIAIALALLGTLTFLVGHLVTAPLTVLLFAVAYLKMTGQAVADPADSFAKSAAS